jgi:peptidoglycan/LPS O-acetylase OafA/YrhL
LAVPSLIGAILPIFGAYVIFWIAFQDTFQLSQFDKHGDFSYGIYVYAFLIQQVLIALFPHVWNPLSLFSVAAVLSLAAGFLSWHGVEKWFLSRRRHRIATSTRPSVGESSLLVESTHSVS